MTQQTKPELTQAQKAAVTTWVEALESDEWAGRQIQKRYATHDGQVCAIGLRDYLYLTRNGRRATFDEVDRCAGTLGANVWTGVSAGEFIGEDENGNEFSAVTANDSLNMTFPEIAQHLRKKFL